MANGSNQSGAALKGQEWCNFDDTDYSESGFFVAFFVSSYAIPLLLIIFLYIGMLHRLWNPGSLGNKISKESLRNKRRVTKWVQFLHKVLSDQRRTNIILFYRLVLVVIVVFCVCWAPIQVVLVLRAVGLYQTKSSEDYPRIIFLIFGQVLAYFNRYVTQLGPNCVTCDIYGP